MSGSRTMRVMRQRFRIAPAFAAALCGIVRYTKSPEDALLLGVLAVLLALDAIYQRMCDAD